MLDGATPITRENVDQVIDQVQRERQEAQRQQADPERARLQQLADSGKASASDLIRLGLKDSNPAR